MTTLTLACNHCAPSEYTRGRGFVLYVHDTGAALASVLDHLQRTNFGMGATAARIDAPPKGPWADRMLAHLEQSSSAMNHESSGVSLCCADVLQGGRYVREWFLVVLDNARGGDVEFDDFCATNHEKPIRELLAAPESPVFALNARAAASRLALVDELLALAEPPLARHEVVDTPFFQLHALDDGHTLDARLLSHVCGFETRALVCLSPTQGFWLVDFPHAGAGLGFPLTLPRRAQFATAEPSPPAPFALVGLGDEGRRRAERWGVYPPVEDSVLGAIERGWFGRHTVARRLRPVWAAVSGRSRHAHRKFEILNAF
jgi:hypothetical protein